VPEKYGSSTMGVIVGTITTTSMNPEPLNLNPEP
jgi:hypothetical protein